MTEVIPPLSMPIDIPVPQELRPTDRERWYLEMPYTGLDQRALNKGVPILEPERSTLEHYPREWGLTVGSLARLLRERSVSDPTENEAILLTAGKSAHWNALMGGAPPQDLPVWEDPHIKDFLALVDEERNEPLEAETAALVELIPEVDKLLKANVDKGIEDGYLPAQAYARLVDGLYSIAGIGLMTQSRHIKIEGQMGQYHQQDAIRILAGQSREEQIETIVHEIMHRMSGGTFREAAGGTVTRERIGFDRYKSNKHGLLNEALTEHLTQAVLHGDFETINPFDRGMSFEDAGSYVTERVLLAELIKRSSGLISVASLLHAYFEDTHILQVGASSLSRHSEARRAMVREFHAAYEPGTLSKFEALDRLAYKEINGSDDLQAFLDRIHPPEFDAEGKVIKKGWIDLSVPGEVPKA